MDAKSIYLPIVIDRAHGIVVHDIDGNTFLDWTGGIGCLNVGHTNEAVSAALHAQVDRFLHTDFTMVPYESYVELAERLLAVTPISGPKKAAFFNSGAEAVENAVKLAKLATGRSAVITFERAFHGRTLMAMSLTSKQHPYKAGMGPFAPEIYRAPYPYPYRGDAIDATEAALDELREMFTTHVAPENVAAIIFEPVQGEGGFIVPPAEWVQGLREIADEHGIVLIADEVQSGYGRTGRMFAIEHFGVEPDIITVAKSIAAGVPISGVLGRAEIVDRGGRQHDRRHLRRLAARLRRRPRRAGSDRAARPAGPRPRDRRADALAVRGDAGDVPAARRRARPGPDAGARVRQGSGDQGAGARAGDGGRRGRDAARPDDPQGGHPRPVPARPGCAGCDRRADRRDARRLRRDADGDARLLRLRRRRSPAPLAEPKTRHYRFSLQLPISPSGFQVRA